MILSYEVWQRCQAPYNAVVEPVYEGRASKNDHSRDRRWTRSTTLADLPHDVVDMMEEHLATSANLNLLDQAPFSLPFRDCCHSVSDIVREDMQTHSEARIPSHRRQANLRTHAERCYRGLAGQLLRRRVRRNCFSSPVCTRLQKCLLAVFRRRDPFSQKMRTSMQ